MNYLNLLKKEIKTKWSTRLLISVFVFILCSSFASIFLLKQEYYKQKNTIPTALKGFNKALNQSFKHIKVDKCFYTQIMFDTSKQFAVYIEEKSNREDKWAKNIYIQNDTLFIKSIDKDVDVFSNSVTDKPILIFAPQIETITLSESGLSIHSLSQKSITINLINKSTLYLNNAIENIDSCKVSMSEHSVFGINYHSSPKNINIKTFEADLSGDCQLQLANAHIKNFKLNAKDNNQIQLSSETLNHLIKK